MKRWAAGLEYLGSRYAGWQYQNHAPSIQQAVEAALSAVADEDVSVTAAGRTDAGVHAFQQVLHFDSSRPRRDQAWLLGSNGRLPHDIALRWVREVGGNFHARHGAVARSYRYVVQNGRARPGLLAQRVAWSPVPLDCDAMQRGAQALVGEHDFSSFRGPDCQSKTPMRNVQSISVRRLDEFVVLDIRANAFLHHMVRNIAGTLLAVGQGRHPETWVAKVLAQRDRTGAGVTADACGLYFIGPHYPGEFGLPAPPAPWFPGRF